ncbi:collagen-binding protein [Bifidobacterium ramosum]|nr:SpaA isopeptide-forming pilin-related protein [Bifidobacterium ramosum]KAB8288548.1 collagen-binding protein [Bifidobacterium ramosum]
MKKLLHQAIAGAAALGIAVSGLALGVGSAYADGDNAGTTATGQIATAKPNENGTITITGDAHTFAGYKLASLKSLTYEAKTNDSDSTTYEMKGFEVETNSAYTSDIVAALDEVKDSKGNTLKSEYEADTAYSGNPIGWLANKKYDTTKETKAPWGGSTTGTDSELRQFATKLAAKLKDKTSTDGTLNSSADGTENNVAQGLWLLRDTTALTDKQETASIPIIVSTTYSVTIGEDDAATTAEFKEGIGTIELKNTKPEVGKQVVKGDAQKGYESEKVPDYNIGDTVPYELSATLPDSYTGYDKDPNYGDSAKANPKKSRTFKIIDTASAALTVDCTPKTGDNLYSNCVESVKVLPKTDTGYDSTKAVKLNAGSDYDVETAAVEYGTDANKIGEKNTEDQSKNTATKVTVDLGKYVNMVAGSTSASAKSEKDTTPNGILEGGKVVVIFKATLNKSALLSDPGRTQGNPNKVALEYSNSPEDMESKHTTPGDEVNVYTYRFKIKKTDKGGAFYKALLGAEFTVKGPNGYLVSKDATTGAWKFSDNESDAEKFKPTEESGEAIIKGLDGLDSGAYTVKEVTVPNGYSSLSKPEFSFTIKPVKEANSTDDPAVDTNTKNPWGQKTWGDFVIGDVTFSGLTGTDKVSGTGASFVTAAAKSGNEFQYTVYNAKNITELPKTGGAGLALIVAVGALFIGAAGIFAARARRNA